MAKKGGNPQNFNNGPKVLADQPLAVRLEVDVDQQVRSLPNRTEWLRRVIGEALERERQNAT